MLLDHVSTCGTQKAVALLTESKYAHYLIPEQGDHVTGFFRRPPVKTPSLREIGKPQSPSGIPPSPSSPLNCCVHTLNSCTCNLNFGALCLLLWDFQSSGGSSSPCLPFPGPLWLLLALPGLLSSPPLPSQIVTLAAGRHFSGCCLPASSHRCWLSPLSPSIPPPSKVVPLAQKC